MAPQLAALGLIYSIYMTTHNCLQLQFQRIRYPHTDMNLGKNTHVHKTKLNCKIVFNASYFSHPNGH